MFLLKRLFVTIKRDKKINKKRPEKIQVMGISSLLYNDIEVIKECMNGSCHVFFL